MLIENKKQAKQYLISGKLSQEQFDNLLNSDPSETKKYVGWMSKMFIGEEKPSIDDLRNTIEEYNTFLDKNKIPNENRDINSFKSFGELKELITKLNSTGGYSIKELENEFDINVDNANLYIVSPHSHEASRKLGLTTFAHRMDSNSPDSSWCTTFKSSTHFADYYYNKKVTFYYILLRGNALEEAKLENYGKIAFAVFPDGKIEAYDANDNLMTKVQTNFINKIIAKYSSVKTEKRLITIKEWKKFKESTETKEPLVLPEPKIKEPIIPSKPSPFRPPVRKKEENPKPKAILFLKEAIKYESPERMHPETQKGFELGTHSLANNPAYPSIKFDELMASKRFKDVIEKLKYYTKITKPITSANDIAKICLSVYTTILEIEEEHKEELEKLAIELIKLEFDLNDDDINIETELGSDEIDISDITPSDVKNLSHLNLEVEKRKFLNSLIHGGAVKTQYCFHLIEDKLEEIYPGLTNLYGIISSMSEYGHWMVPDNIENAQDSAVGKVKVKLDTEIPQVKAEGKIFPFLVHELAKGVLEVLLSHDKLEEEERKYVISKADSLSSETSSLRIGPAFWEKLNEAIFDAKQKDKRNHIIAHISTLPAEEFNEVMKNILDSDKKKAIDQINKIVKEMEF